MIKDWIKFDKVKIGRVFSFGGVRLYKKTGVKEFKELCQQTTWCREMHDIDLLVFIKAKAAGPAKNITA